MPDQKKEDALDPEEKLVKDILSTKAFRNARLRAELLRFLGENSSRYVTVNDLFGLFGLNEDYLRNDEHIRERIKDLRDALKDFALLTDLPLVCSLPNAVQGQGYKLLFAERGKESATHFFWKTHLGKHPPIFVYPEPMFYYDIERGSYTRFLNTNPESHTRDAALNELERLHAPDVKVMFGDDPRAKLRPSHAYVGMGEVEAMESIGEWLEKNSVERVNKVASEKAGSLKEYSPICLGSQRTNRFIHAFREKHHYSLAEKISHIAIKEATEQEKEAVAKYDGHTENGMTVAGQPATTSPVRYRFVIISRVTMPGSFIKATLISSDATLAVRQAGRALTDDEQLGGILDKAGWASMPDEFEMLLSVRIAFGSMEDEADIPELLACRSYSEPQAKAHAPSR